MVITDNFDEFVSVYHHKKRDIEIYDALTLIFKLEDIKTRDEFKEIMTPQELYNRIEKISYTHWNKINEPEAAIRARYQHILEGYKKFKKQ